MKRQYVSRKVVLLAAEIGQKFQELDLTLRAVRTRQKVVRCSAAAAASLKSLDIEDPSQLVMVARSRSCASAVDVFKYVKELKRRQQELRSCFRAVDAMRNNRRGQLRLNPL